MVVAPDPGWPARFEIERARIAPLLPGAEIHHIGSTAVPGLPAKPIIDVMALVDDMDAAVPALIERGGYRYPEATNAMLTDRRFLCRPSPAARTHHLHLADDRAVLDRHLRFRDALRADAALAAAYGELKLRLAERHRRDREAYTDAKTKFIDAVARA